MEETKEAKYKQGFKKVGSAGDYLEIDLWESEYKSQLMTVAHDRIIDKYFVLIDTVAIGDKRKTPISVFLASDTGLDIIGKFKKEYPNDEAYRIIDTKIYVSVDMVINHFLIG